MIVEIKKYLARCDKCARSIYGFNGGNVMRKDELERLLKSWDWKYNFKTKKCKCNQCEVQK